MVVAAFDNRHVGAYRVEVAGDSQGKRHVVHALEREARRVAIGVPHKQRQHLHALGAEHHVDDVTVGLAEERRALLLRDAAGHGDGTAAAGFLLEDAELAQPCVQLVFGVLPDTAPY
jgi:hypothetical protein